MTNELPADQIVPALSGELGDEVQFRSVVQMVTQHVDVVMGRIKFVGADGVAISQTGVSQPLIHQPS